MTRLRQMMIEEMNRRNYAASTIRGYVTAIAAFALFFRRPPDQLGAKEIRAWQLRLHDRGLSFSTYNLHSCALRFFYGTVLGLPDMTTLVPFARRERKLPMLLSQDEVRAMLAAIVGGRDRVVVTIAYACGLRVSEVASLRVADIDGARKLLHVRDGKGHKDRLVPLPDSLLELLRNYWRVYRPGEWLFPGESAGTHVHARTIQRVVREAAVAAGIKKKVTPHVLRHCFATHMLEAGVDIRIVQSLLGHNSATTTVRYHHMSRTVVTATTNPLDLLEATKPKPR